MDSGSPDAEWLATVVILFFIELSTRRLVAAFERTFGAKIFFGTDSLTSTPKLCIARVTRSKNSRRGIFRTHRSALRNDLARPIDRLLRADHQRAREIVFLADVFEQFHAGLHEQEETTGPRRGVGAGIVNRDLVFDRIRIGASETLAEMKLVGRGEAIAVEPEALVETDRVDDERIAFPMADRMPVIGRNKLLRVWAAIHEDSSERVWTADIENEDSFFDGILHEFYTVGRQELAWSARWLAARVRLELVFTAVSMQSFRPRLERHLTRI
jgi:hypothetical protein